MQRPRASRRLGLQSVVGFEWLALHHQMASPTMPTQYCQSCKMRVMAQRVDVLECLGLVTRSHQVAATSLRERGRVRDLDWASGEKRVPL